MRTFPGSAVTRRVALVVACLPSVEFPRSLCTRGQVSPPCPVLSRCGQVRVAATGMGRHPALPPPGASPARPPCSLGHPGGVAGRPRLRAIEDDLVSRSVDSPGVGADVLGGGASSPGRADLLSSAVVLPSEGSPSPWGSRPSRGWGPTAESLGPSQVSTEVCGPGMPRSPHPSLLSLPTPPPSTYS